MYTMPPGLAVPTMSKPSAVNHPPLSTVSTLMSWAFSIDQLLGRADGVVRVVGREPADPFQFGVDARYLGQGVGVHHPADNAGRMQAQLVIRVATVPRKRLPQIRRGY
ncbi:hypothetical protein [Streptomyces sp. NPDC048419]|uniref:hypothetical protein n=1 Tax=Streptomyces sp. NPDC048419 TaxID=3365547 RepID=UPI0037167E6E